MKQSTPHTAILQAALTAFNQSTGLTASTLPAHAQSNDTTHAFSPDVTVQVTTPHETIRFAAVIRTRLDRASVALAVVQQLIESPEPPLLIAPYVSPKLAKVCQDHQLSFMDCAGNAAIFGADTLVFVVGRRPVKSALFTRRSSGRAFGESGLRILYNCLVDPDLFQGTYRQIAAASGTALGTVSGVFGDLREQGLLVENKRRQRHWLSKQRIIDAWVVNYPLRLRPKLHPRRFRTQQNEWWKRLDPLAVEMQWGGEVAAFQLSSQLPPMTKTLYAHGSIAKLAKKLRLVLDDDGDIEVLDAFWPMPNVQSPQARVASPLLVIADLLADGHPRGVQVARSMREQFLA